MYRPLLSTTALDLVIDYSERTQRLELAWESGGPPGNPLDPAQLPDELGLSIVENLAEEIAYERRDDRNRVSMRMREC